MQHDGAKMETVRYGNSNADTTGPSMAGPCSAPITRPTRPWLCTLAPDRASSGGGAVSPMMGDPRRGAPTGTEGTDDVGPSAPRPSEGRTCGGRACFPAADSLFLGRE